MGRIFFELLYIVFGQLQRPDRCFKRRFGTPAARGSQSKLAGVAPQCFKAQRERSIGSGPKRCRTGLWLDIVNGQDRADEDDLVRSIF